MTQAAKKCKKITFFLHFFAFPSIFCDYCARSRAIHKQGEEQLLLFFNKVFVALTAGLTIFSFPSIRCSLRSRLCLCSAKLFFDKKRTSEEVLILRSNPVDVSWEHGAFFDVGDAEEARRDALQTDGEAAMRGHAVAEGLLSESESIRIHATTEHLLAVVGCSVRPSASDLCSPLCPSRAPQARISPAPQRLSARRRRAYPAPRMAYPRPAHTRSYEVYFPLPTSSIPPDCIKSMVSLLIRCLFLSRLSFI